MVDDGRMDDGSWLHYKLTNEPKDSGELKMKLGSKYGLLDTPHNLKYKEIYQSNYLQIVEKSNGSSRSSWFHKLCRIKPFFICAVV